jgi:recombinational DNA repair ATPase RecF
VFNLRPDYLATAQDYERVLKTRNTVLRQIGDETSCASSP